MAAAALTTPDLNSQSDALKKVTTTLEEYKKIMGDASFGNISFASNLTTVTKLLEENGIKLQEVGNITDQTSRKIALITGGAIQAGKAFEYMSGVDTKNLNTFSSQLDFIRDTIGKAVGSKDQNQLINLAKSFGLASSEIGKTMDKDAGGKFAINFSKLGDAVSKAAENMAQHADNALMLQEVYLSAAAATGTYDKVMQIAGQTLEELNGTIDIQQTLITSTAKATHLTTDAVRSYYVALGNVPGALDATVSSTGAAQTKMSMLQATMELAKGTGRSFTDIVEDLNKAYENYGVTGQSALQFSARMSEASNKLGMRLQDVRQGLSNIGSSFSGIANVGEAANRMIENAASLYTEYTAALQKTGLAATQASGIASNLIGKFKELSLEQKAFLSSQTGGPGGLMGGFRIEKMLREGDVAGVQKLVTQMLEKQFGKIVSLEEASASQGAAAQRARQIALIRQGPLGSLASTQEDAGRLLDALRLRKEGAAATKLEADYLQTRIERGQKLRELTATPFSQARGETQQFLESPQGAVRDMFQEAFAARRGFTLGGIPDEDMAAIQNRSEEIKKANRIFQKESTGAVLDSVTRAFADPSSIRETNAATRKQMTASMSGFVTGSVNILNNVLGSTFTRALFGRKDTTAQQQEIFKQAVENAMEKKKQEEAESGLPATAVKAAKPPKRVAPTAAVAATEPTAEARKIDLQVTAICYHCKKELERGSPHLSGTQSAVKPKSK